MAWTIEAAGVTALRWSGGTYFMDPVGGGEASGPQIRYNGAPWTAGQNGSWVPIGAEQTANGYSVWWQYGTADQFVQWTTDLAGNWVSNGAFVTRIRYALQADETTFQQDLNGDGTIGVVSSEIETAGNTKLAQVADQYFMYQGDGSSGVLLRKDGAPWTVGQDYTWRVLGAEQTANGYSVWQRAGTGNFYRQWNTDFAGNYVSTVANTNGGTYAVQSTETTFQQDLNGDGTIGLASSSIETVGNTKLAQVSDMYFMYQGDGSSGVLVRYNGQASDPGGIWKPIGAEQTASGYSVWLGNGVGQFVEWNTDSSGNYVSNGSTIVSNKGYALEASEPDFQQDFNGDGTLGVVSTSIETAGNTKLAQVADMYFVYTGDGSSGLILREGDSYFAAGRMLGIEKRTDGDYDAMMRVGTDQYEVWRFTSGGTGWSRPFFFNPFHASSFQMQDAENRFQQDFNGNGVIGSGEQMMSSSGSSAAAADPALLLNYMASTFATPAGDGTGAVAGAQASDQAFLTKPLA
jgi:serralysin